MRVDTAAGPGLGVDHGDPLAGRAGIVGPAGQDRTQTMVAGPREVTAPALAGACAVTPAVHWRCLGHSKRAARRRRSCALGRAVRPCREWDSLE